jgi:hypothetical protein
MKTTLFLSALTAGVLAVSTASFAQEFGNYAQAVGDAAAAQSVAPRYVAPIDRFTRSDLGYEAKATAPHAKRRASRASQAQ